MCLGLDRQVWSQHIAAHRPPWIGNPPSSEGGCLSAGVILRQRTPTALILVSLVLAIFGMAAASHSPLPRVPEKATTAGGAPQSERQASLRKSSALQISAALRGSNPFGLEIVGQGSASSLRSHLRGGRIPKLGVDRHTAGAAASRTRMVYLLYREVDTSLAYARVGTAAYQSTAPPSVSNS